MERYLYTLGFWPSFFEGGQRSVNYYHVPDGFDLVEQKEHKKKRLESTIEALESEISNLRLAIANRENQLENTKKELKDLDN